MVNGNGGQLELSETIHDEIERLCAAGDALAEQSQFAQALASYWAAWDLLPEPKTEWEAATWILGAIGDANFLGGDFVAGRDNLGNAMHCPDAIGNPFLHLRLGQCQFELGALDRAADELTRAYMGAGADIFSDQDPSICASCRAERRMCRRRRNRGSSGNDEGPGKPMTLMLPRRVAPGLAGSE